MTDIYEDPDAVDWDDEIPEDDPIHDMLRQLDDSAEWWLEAVSHHRSAILEIGDDLEDMVSVMVRVAEVEGRDFPLYRKLIQSGVIPADCLLVFP